MSGDMGDGVDLVLRARSVMRAGENVKRDETVSAEDLVMDQEDVEIIEDLSEVFKQRLQNASIMTRSSLLDAENELASGPNQEPGQGGLFSALFARFDKHSAEAKKRHIGEARSVLDILDHAAEAFPKEYREYQQSVALLDAELKKHPGYRDYVRSLHETALGRGSTPEKVTAMLHDPFIKTDDIMSLRGKLNSVIEDPAIKPLFEATEKRFKTVNKIMDDVGSGISTLGKEKGLNMAHFRPLEDVVGKMADGVENSPISRPGGPVMSGDNNALKKSISKVSETIRKLVEKIVNSFRPSVKTAGPSMSF